MSKIVQAVNAMITHPELITNVIRGGDEHEEFFFLYKNKYKWSISKRDGDHSLWYYPAEEPLEALASYEGPDWSQIATIMYRDSEIGTKEAKASFSELYTLVKERIYKVNEVLEDIISDSDLA